MVLDNAVPVTTFLREIQEPVRQAFAGRMYTVIGDVDSYYTGKNLHNEPYQVVTLVDIASNRSSIVRVFIDRYILNELALEIDKTMRLSITGTIDAYNNELQIRAKKIEPQGEATMFKQIVAWRYKFLHYFNRPKKALPMLCSNIALVTQEKSQGCDDFYAHLGYGNVTLCPTVMQGPTSADSIAQTIRDINAADGYDCICLLRGGGSSYHLFDFNKPQIIEAIGNSRIPVIVAIGHESDRPLCEDAADVRCATPTALGQLLTERANALNSNIYQLQKSIDNTYNRILAGEKQTDKTNKIIISAAVIVGVLLFTIYQLLR